MATKSKSEVQVPMTHTKSTKNFERYDAADGAAVTNLYIAKGNLGDSVPSKITVTVTAAD